MDVMAIMAVYAVQGMPGNVGGWRLWVYDDVGEGEGWDMGWRGLKEGLA